MPRFSFTIDDGKNPRETTAVDLPDLDRAKEEAIRAAGEMLTDIGAGTVWNGVPWTLTVHEPDGHSALEVQFLITGHPKDDT